MRFKLIPYLFFFVICSIRGVSQEKMKVKSVSFNTISREYAPIFHKNGLVFSGTIENNEMITYLDKNTGEKLTNLLYVPLVNDSFGNVVLFSKELKSNFHDGSITFSKDEKTAYFSQNQLATKNLKNGGNNKIGIYRASYIDGKWSNITPSLFNSEQYNVGQPSLSSDGKTLYVTSDIKGGEGGIDIYYVNLNDGNGDSLINLGSNINTEADEMFPFIKGNNNLFFSSNKKNGFGGLDIYSSILLNGSWNSPQKLDSVVNSSFDDFGVVFDEKGTSGYFCSNRAGSDDIYKLVVEFPKFIDCQETTEELLCYEFFEKNNLNPEDHSMVYEWDFGDGNKKRSLNVTHCYEKSGIYTVELNVKDPSIGKTFVNKATYKLKIEPVIQPGIMCSDTMSIMSNFDIEVSQGKWDEFLIDNYYIDYGDSVILKNNVNGHRYQNEGQKEIRVLISGYNKTTKEINSKCFNKTIFIAEEKIVSTVQNELFDSLYYSDPSSDRLPKYDNGFYTLEIISSSESLLEDFNKLKDYVNIVEEIYDKESEGYSYILGKKDNPFELIKDFRNAHLAGYTNAIVKYFNSTEIKIEDLGVIFESDLGDVGVILKEIKFDYRGYLLDENSKIELTKLIQYLKKHKEVKIEIGAHTDSKGSDSYNMKLSQKRANSVVAYINSQGIEMKRLKSKGFGESQPIESNSFSDGSDNPQGRTKNRRVVFKIISK